jgi:DNA-binding Lrp family transcriptional regulator
MDGFDHRLLAALQADGRLTNQELADLVHLSPSQCSRRRLQLESSGVITGYHAQVDRAATGHDMVVFVNVTLENHDAANASEFAALVQATPAIQEAHAMTGDMDYLLKITARNLADLQQLINQVLLPHRAVRHVHSAIALETLKEGTSVPLG